MRHWIDEDTGTKMCEPDCADEWMWDIWAIGVDHDGCRTVDEFKKLVDELVEMALKARECLWKGELFGTHGRPETAVPVVLGVWKPYCDHFTKRQVGWICTNCSGVQIDLSNGNTNYCPNCGAMMDDVETD